MNEPHEIAAFDAFGTWLMPGDVVTYGVTHHSSILLNVGLIEKITAFTDHRGTRAHLGVRRTRVSGREHAYNRSISRATLTELSRVVKLHPEYYTSVVQELLAAP